MFQLHDDHHGLHHHEGDHGLDNDEYVMSPISPGIRDLSGVADLVTHHQVECLFLKHSLERRNGEERGVGWKRILADDSQDSKWGEEEGSGTWERGVEEVS